MQDPSSESGLEGRLAAIRFRTRPAVLERIDAIETAIVDPAHETLPAAREQAHKLRGLLGTIGLPHGSELAATIEVEVEHAIAGDAEDGWETRVGKAAAALRAAIEAP